MRISAATTRSRCFSRRRCSSALVAGLTLCLWWVRPAWAVSASDADEAFLRGLFDHQSVAIRYDRLALSRGSDPRVRRFAQIELKMYQTLGDRMTTLERELGMIELGAGGAASMPLGAGVSRGFAVLPTGAQWARASVLEFLVGGGADQGRFPVLDDSLLLNKLTGDEFDKQYLLRVILMHQRMIRHALREMQLRDANPAVLEYAQNSLAVLNAQTEEAGNLYNGVVVPAGPPP